MSTEGNNIVNIEAAPNTRRFDKISQAVDGAESHISGYKIVATIDGIERSEDLGDYNKQKFPGAVHSTMPFFDKERRMYIFQRQDGTIWTQEDLNKAVKDIPMYYAHWDKNRAGQRIESANLTDFGDAYICRLRTDLFEGEGRLNLDSPIEKAFEEMMRGNRTFMDETSDEIRSSEVEYILKNPKVAQERETSQREEKELALEYYAGMKTDVERMRKILILFGVDTEDSVSAGTVRNLLFKKVDDNVNRERGQTYQKLFVEYAGLPETELDLRSTVALAAIRRIIWEKGGMYEFEGLGLGGTYEAVLDYFRKGENSRTFDVIKFRIKERK